jgi:hypothetical protein
MKTWMWLALGAGVVYLIAKSSKTSKDAADMFKAETFLKLEAQGLQNIIVQDPTISGSYLCANYSHSAGSGTECKPLTG